jgi:geranylgeranyl reductase
MNAMTSTTQDVYDVVVVGGGPSGATAAHGLASLGHRVLLLDRAGRIKPCGGAVPPRLIADFAIPPELLVARIHSARMVSPAGRAVDMPIDGGFVGMVDRASFDEWLRERAASAGATRMTGTFLRCERTAEGSRVVFTQAEEGGAAREIAVSARAVIGADGALSAVARQCVPGAADMPFVFAYHEIVRAPACDHRDYDGRRCDVYYQGGVSPDFYGWIFPHGDTVSVGTGSAQKGFALRPSVAALRDAAGLGSVETIRREGAPIPLKPLKRWDDGRNVLLAGDAAGVVAPASGEGIYYAMVGGQFAADAIDEFLITGEAAALQQARRRFMRMHGMVFFILGVMQGYWYRSDRRRERFVSICRDRDVQKLTWDAYMNKRLVRARPAAHVRIFLKNIAHMAGIATA